MRRTIIVGLCAFAVTGLAMVAPRVAGSLQQARAEAVWPACSQEPTGAGLFLGPDRVAEICGTDGVLRFPPRFPWLCLPTRGIGCSLGLAPCWYGSPPVRTS